MKKVVLTILAFTYLAVSSGATINLHYCMGRLISWDLSPTQQSTCDNCGMEKNVHKKGCCKDEKKVLQIEKDQKAAEQAYQFAAVSSEAIITTYAALPAVPVSSVVIGQPSDHAPPRPGNLPVFLLNCNFRI